jgi:hypothetical protein
VVADMLLGEVLSRREAINATLHGKLDEVRTSLGPLLLSIRHHTSNQRPVDGCHDLSRGGSFRGKHGTLLRVGTSSLAWPAPRFRLSISQKDGCHVRP